MKFFSRLQRLKQNFRWMSSGLTALESLHDLTLFHQTRQLQLQGPNPLNAYGKKCFSQSDEDGITLEILRRMNSLQDGVYAEFGVGDGTENNTLILAALGWKGFWAGAEALKPDVVNSDSSRFLYMKQWITVDNIVELAGQGLRTLGCHAVDVMSFDLDGNDIYLIETLLSAQFRPKLFIVEYNAKFPPPVEFKIKYDSEHIWQGDDYFGASLASFVKVFAQFDYKLVCCNSHTGSNAFFVDGRFADKFDDVPSEIAAIYKEPRYWLYRHQYGHPVSVKTVERIINGD